MQVDHYYLHYMYVVRGGHTRRWINSTDKGVGLTTPCHQNLVYSRFSRIFTELKSRYVVKEIIPKIENCYSIQGLVAKVKDMVPPSIYCSRPH